MDHIEHPTRDIWDSRRMWFEQFIFHHEESGNHITGPQANALISDVQSCFCAGAWVSTIIIAATVMEANLQETSPDIKRKNFHALAKENNLSEKLDPIRNLRNKLVHATQNNPTLTVEQQFDDRDTLEQHARSAITLMFEVFYLKKSISPVY